MNKENHNELMKNPLIGMYPSDTLETVSDAIEYMQSSTLGPSGTTINISDKATTGFYFLMRCIQGAVYYEAVRTEQTRKEAINAR